MRFYAVRAVYALLPLAVTALPAQTCGWMMWNWM